MAVKVLFIGELGIALGINEVDKYRYRHIGFSSPRYNSKLLFMLSTLIIPEMLDIPSAHTGVSHKNVRISTQRL